MSTKESSTNIENLEVVTIRFAGDSGDGMQLTGNQFTDNTAIFGNDLATFPDFPAEIRAPAGTLAGVSSFQLQFSSEDVHTPGDELDVLVAMNPAALKVHLKDLKENGILIINEANYTKRNFNLAGWEVNPLEDDTLKPYRLINENMTKLVGFALEDMGLGAKVVSRSTNMFALGLVYWLYERSFDSTIDFLNKKFAKKPELIEANTRALKAGYNYGDTIEVVKTTYKVPQAEFEKGTYRNIMGNNATVLGLMAASEKAEIDLFFAGYPITPASTILHGLAARQSFGVKTFQAEDEIAAICCCLGAAFAGDLSVTASSGPGIALKGEALGLAIMTELPLVVINVQRGGPSTGLPTKTEQSDLLQAMYGRNGEAPLAIVAASSPSDCFDSAFEACRIALEHMIPVILLTDGYIANGSEPWKIPDIKNMPKIKTNLISNSDKEFLPYKRDNKTMARSWALPGVKGLEHRVGGLEKEDQTGNVSYDSLNHQNMTDVRQQKIDAIANTIPLIETYGDSSGSLLLVSWGGTFGSVRSAVDQAISNGLSVSHVHIKYINPFPQNLGDILLKFENVLIPELNAGQLSIILRNKFLINSIGLNKVEGKPFSTGEIYSKILNILGKK
tara:strand:+ start:3370 stop:5223 length:1854 start_codon:yes stop_codon:yes gene_type:complete